VYGLTPSLCHFLDEELVFGQIGVAKIELHLTDDLLLLGPTSKNFFFLPDD